MSTVDVIRLVSAMLNIVMVCLIFLIFCSHFSISLRKNASISDNLLNQYVCDSFGAIGFEVWINFGFIVVYAHCLFNSYR